MTKVKVTCSQCGQQNWTNEEFCSKCSNSLYENCNSRQDINKVNFDNFYNLFSW